MGENPEYMGKEKHQNGVNLIEPRYKFAKRVVYGRSKWRLGRAETLPQQHQCQGPLQPSWRSGNFPTQTCEQK